MYKYEFDDEIIDVETLMTEEIVLEEDIMEEIRKRVAQTGENPDDLAERFKKRLEDLRAQTPEETLEWYRLVYYYANQKKLKTAV